MENKTVLCNNVDDIIRILPKVSLDFNNNAYFEEKRVPPYNLRKHHWYPATFTPALPYTLIEILTKPSATVLDPFFGIGTTLLQALILGRNPVGIESCHVATQFLKSFMYLLKNYNKVAKGFNEWLEVKYSYNSTLPYTNNLPKSMQALRQWYHPDTFNELNYVRNKLNISEDEIFKSILTITLSNSLMRLSSQNKGWGYIADNVLPKGNELRPKYLFKTLDGKIRSLLNDINYLHRVIPQHIINNIFVEDTFIQANIFDKNLPLTRHSVDAIITSPPYPNMIDYARSQRLSYYFWNLPFEEDIANEFASRRKRNQKNSKEEYVYLMVEVNNILSTALKSGGYLCYTLPEFESNTQKQELILTILADLEDRGLHEVARFTRSISSTNRINNTSLASLNKELVIIYKKG